MSELLPEEIPFAQLLAFEKSLTRGGGNIPPYDPNEANGDFCHAAGKIINLRGQLLIHAANGSLIHDMQNAIIASVVTKIKSHLDKRGTGWRDQTGDNLVFVPLREATVLAFDRQDFGFAIKLFDACFPVVRDFENKHNCELHKGAPTFNVAIAYLATNDFPAAMHYFEFAQQETSKTTTNALFSIYTFDLFENNFWQLIHSHSAMRPIQIYSDLWQIPYDLPNALNDYSEMSQDLKLAYIIATAERVRLQNLEDHSGWNESNALRHGYWRLVADLARLLEVETKRRCKLKPGADVPDTIVKCLVEGFQTTSFGNISRELEQTLRPMFPRKPPNRNRSPTPAQLYELHFDGMLARVRNKSLKREERLCTALYLLGFTRNQVAHKVDENSKLFKQLEDAKYLADLFLTLCRTKEWRAL